MFHGKSVCFFKGRSEQVPLLLGLVCPGGVLAGWQCGISHKNRLLVFQPIPLLRSHEPNYMILRSYTLKYINIYEET